MGSIQRKQQLKKFLLKFNDDPIVLSENNKPLGPMQQFIVTYFGMSFIQGYRIIEKVEVNTFVMSSMQIQSSQNCEESKPQFRIIQIEYNQKINEDRTTRTLKYQNIKQIVEFFCNGNIKIQIVFISAYNFLTSTINFESLQKCEPLTFKNFYVRDYGIGKQQQKQSRVGLRVLNQTDQGIRLHELVELYIKGSGQVANQKYLKKKVFQHSKFAYEIDKVMNTICLVIGKEMIQGSYTTITSEKWMRKSLQKKFKRFDLLLRNQKKVCILDWKFSKSSAFEKITAEAFAKKNRLYFQLARKQYNAQVQLKFYCFHQAWKGNHHIYTTASYQYKIENIQLNDDQYEQIRNKQIEISDSEDQKIQRKRRSHKIKNKSKKNMNEDSDDQYSRVIYNIDSKNIEFNKKGNKKNQNSINIQSIQDDEAISIQQTPIIDLKSFSSISSDEIQSGSNSQMEIQQNPKPFQVVQQFVVAVSDENEKQSQKNMSSNVVQNNSIVIGNQNYFKQNNQSIFSPVKINIQPMNFDTKNKIQESTKNTHHQIRNHETTKKDLIKKPIKPFQILEEEQCNQISQQIILNSSQIQTEIVTKRTRSQQGKSQRKPIQIIPVCDITNENVVYDKPCLSQISQNQKKKTPKSRQVQILNQLEFHYRKVRNISLKDNMKYVDFFETGKNQTKPEPKLKMIVPKYVQQKQKQKLIIID